MTSPKYDQLPEELIAQIEQDKQNGTFGRFACPNEAAVRRNPDWDKNTLLRPSFVRDCEKILHLPVYNRYNDKTQVFSFYQNDDISRRGLHVQLVSRIARNIGRLLGLNLDLIEAIALGHDLGHTPFGHAGERYLDHCLKEHTGRRFFHNVHSVRVLDTLYRRNVSLQVLDGILCHNGEFEQQEYRPVPLGGFDGLDAQMELCYTAGDDAVAGLIPSTLEGCVVRLSDMIAYLGKDRQDAVTAKILPNMNDFTSRDIGVNNSTMINNLVVDVVKNSYGKGYIQMSPLVYEDLRTAKKENYQLIYGNPNVDRLYGDQVEEMFHELYERLLQDLLRHNTASPLFSHHIAYVKQHQGYYDKAFCYEAEDPNQLVVDYLAGMTDTYFIGLYEHLFPGKKHITPQPYFEE